MDFKSSQYKDYYINDCCICSGTGVVYKEKVALRGELFLKEDVEDDCFLCLGEGIIEIVDKPVEKVDRKTEGNTQQSDLYRGGSSFL